MFEKFTEKAINVVSESQKTAAKMHNTVTQPEHLFLAILKEAKGISLKIFKTYGLEYEPLQKAVEDKLRFEHSNNESSEPPFSVEYKKLLKQALDLADKNGYKYILYEHLFLIVLSDEKSYIRRILDKFNFDIDTAKQLLTRLVQKKIKKISHPETTEDSLRFEEKDPSNAESFFDGKNVADIFKASVFKMRNSNYEVLGTEQIVSTILANQDSELVQALDCMGIDLERFESKNAPRALEFEINKFMLTPSAYLMMNSALQTAKELGASEVLPEHIILGLLKSKKGIAYNIFKQLKIVDNDLENLILKPIERQKPETLTILKLAKQEARRLGRNIVGTEMFLLGIIADGSTMAADVLSGLEVNIKDTRVIVEDLIGYGNEYFDIEIAFTPRAKKVLEIAWDLAKKYNLTRIKSEHLLYAITTVPDSLAMKALEQLGVDVIEVRQGIIKEASKNRD